MDNEIVKRYEARTNAITALAQQMTNGIENHAQRAKFRRLNPNSLMNYVTGLKTRELEHLLSEVSGYEETLNAGLEYALACKEAFEKEDVAALKASRRGIGESLESLRALSSHSRDMAKRITNLYSSFARNIQALNPLNSFPMTKYVDLNFLVDYGREKKGLMDGLVALDRAARRSKNKADQLCGKTTEIYRIIEGIKQDSVLFDKDIAGHRNYFEVSP